jgi:hypothetical protein
MRLAFAASTCEEVRHSYAHAYGDSNAHARNPLLEYPSHLQPAAYVQVSKGAEVVVGEAELDQCAAASEGVGFNEANGVAVQAERPQVACTN